MLNRAIVILILMFLSVSPVFSDYLDINGDRIYYRVEGKGEPLLLLHSGIDSSEVFKPVIEELKRDYMLIVIDSRGHGRSSDNGKRPFSYNSFAEDVITVLDRLKIDKVNAVGYSDGGVLCYILGSKYPSRVKKAVACGANYRVEGMTEGTVKWVRESLYPENIKKTYKIIYDEYVRLSPHSDKYPQYINKSREMWLRDPYLTDEQMKSIKVPLLVIGGDRDIIKTEHLLKIKRMVKGAQLCILPDTPHNVFKKSPSLVSGLIKRFLK